MRGRRRYALKSGPGGELKHCLVALGAAGGQSEDFDNYSTNRLTI
jgi:hypothetical protein